MTTPDPPAWLHGAPARAAWANGFRACAARCEWEPIFERLLGVLAQAAGLYVQLVREVAELPPATISDDLREAITAQRRKVRELMAEFLLIKASAIGEGSLRLDGLDAEIADLCDVPAVQ